MSLITFEVNPFLSCPLNMAQAYAMNTVLQESPSVISGLSLPNVLKQGALIKKSNSPPKITLLDKMIENPVLNRLGNDLLGVALPTIGIEFLLRGWQRGVEMCAVMIPYIATTFVVPTAFMPLWNNMATKEYNLPSEFSRLHEIGFEDLLIDKDINAFRDKLQKLEGKEKIEKYLAGLDDGNAKLCILREKLIKAKSSAIRKNIFTTGLFANLVYWFKNWFAKSVLGVTGFTGELNVLDESQVERNSGSYEKNKFFLFSGAILSYLFGSHLFSNAIEKSASAKKSDVKTNPILDYIRKNIDTFDIQDGKFPNRGNLFGMYMTGGIFSYFFASRSVTEFIENVIRLTIWFPMAMWGDTYIKNMSASKMDKSLGTSLLEYDKKTQVKTVKSLEKLYKELEGATVSGNQGSVELLTRSIKARKKMDLSSLLKNALIMGIGLTAFNALFSSWRLRNGIGVNS
ncbi:MAG: hypothetical protein HYR97_02955 [Candidatus Melainabacteria bacterium]|nr:hypothetical protein [Candidatus Melainabacteria bacterium]MBI3309585.1 hypothetical protein [Candidatus Melainabacteria bacterium]